MAVPYTFATATSSIPLSQLDANFATGITLGNTTVYLGNTTTSIGNLTLTNATISSVASTFPNSYLANSSVTIGSTNVSLGGTATTIAGLTLTSPTITGGTSTATQNLANVTGTLAVGNGGTGLTSLTAGYIPYGNGTSAFGSSANLTFNGTTLTLANDASISGLTVGKGGGANADNTALGANALFSNSTGTQNVAVGKGSFYSATSANFNTGLGFNSGYYQTGVQNTAIGLNALYGASGTSTGVSNVAVGFLALTANTSGSSNTSVGTSALQANTTANNNTAVGYQAGYSGSSANGNSTLVGYQAGYTQNNGVTGQSENTFIGYRAGYGVTTGVKNTFIGGGISSGVGAGGSMTTGNNNTILGVFSGNQGGLDIRTASNYIVLSDGDGNPRGVFDNNGMFSVGAPTETISNVSTASFQSATNAFPDTVHIGNNNTAFTNAVMQLKGSRNTTNNSWYLMIGVNTGVNKILIADSGSVTNATGTYGTISDVKLKENIVDATSKLDDICKLQVRNFNLKTEPNLKQIGFIAQEVEQVFPAMIEEHTDKDADGNDLESSTKSVKTSILVPMLVKAIQELKAEVDALKQQLNGA